MKRKIISLAAIAALALSTIGFVSYADNQPRTVQTTISEMGVGSTFYDPPEIIPLSEHPLTYHYTAEIPANKNAVNIQQTFVNRTSYYYTNQINNEFVYDNKGRINVSAKVLLPKPKKEEE